jgi:hypothetical protein
MLMKWRMGALLEEKVLSGPGRKALCANPKVQHANTDPHTSTSTISISIIIPIFPNIRGLSSQRRAVKLYHRIANP